MGVAIVLEACVPAAPRGVRNFWNGVHPEPDLGRTHAFLDAPVTEGRTTRLQRANHGAFQTHVVQITLLPNNARIMTAAT